MAQLLKPSSLGLGNRMALSRSAGRPLHVPHASPSAVAAPLRHGGARRWAKDRRRAAAVAAGPWGPGGLTALITRWGGRAERMAPGLHALQPVPQAPAGERRRRPGGGKTPTETTPPEGL